MAHLHFRDAYHQAQRDEIEHLRRLRSLGDTGRVELPGIYKSRAIRDLTDAQIDAIALATAERTIHAVIHQHNDERIPD